jgi:hypothetical protein
VCVCLSAFRGCVFEEVFEDVSRAKAEKKLDCWTEKLLSVFFLCVCVSGCVCVCVGVWVCVCGCVCVFFPFSSRSCVRSPPGKPFQAS